MIATVSDFVLVLVGAVGVLFAVSAVGAMLLGNKGNKRGSFYTDGSHDRLMKELAGHD